MTGSIGATVDVSLATADRATAPDRATICDHAFRTLFPQVVVLMSWYTVMRGVNLEDFSTPGDFIMAVVEDDDGHFFAVGDGLGLMRDMSTSSVGRVPVRREDAPTDRALQWLGTQPNGYWYAEEAVEEPRSASTLQEMLITDFLGGTEEGNYC